MLRLAMTLFAVIATTLMGSFVVVALVTGYDTLQPVLAAAAAGFVAAIPVTWIVTKKLV